MNMPDAKSGNTLSINPLVQFLDKPPEAFERRDIVGFAAHAGITTLNLRYVALDGKLKELKVPVLSKRYLEQILADGERVDGSSLFGGLIDLSESDLYVVPIYRSAFVDPFVPSTLDIVCRFFNKYGDPVEVTPDNALYKAADHFRSATGCDLRALGELEFYLIFDRGDIRFPSEHQRNYQQASPFLHGAGLVSDIICCVSAMTGCVKYCHSEVGFIDQMESPNQELDGKRLEQYELEFLPARIEDMASHLTVAKWAIRNVAYKHGASVTFAPKIEEGVAGNGLHVHLELLKNGANAMTTKDGDLSPEAVRLVGGLLTHSPALTAFANTRASAYLRLVPNQEAPTRISWSDMNRTTLVRVPLGWRHGKDMSKAANPTETETAPERAPRQTVEIRNPDSSAHIHLLLAGLAMAAEDGLLSPESEEYTKSLYVVGNVFTDEALMKKLKSLPSSCSQSADALIAARAFFEKDGVFPPKIIDYVCSQLKAEGDEELNALLSRLPANERLVETKRIMHKDLHMH